MDRHETKTAAGIAGPAAGVYARRGGVDATLVEQYFVLGVLCASWSSKEYLLKGAIHWLDASSLSVEGY